MVSTAIIVSKEFEDVSVWSALCIKPLNIDMVIDIARSHQLIVTLEEHSIYGGLGSAIAEITSEYFPTRVHKIGIQDRFSKFCGSYQYLIKEHHLDFESVFSAVKNLPIKSNFS